MRANLLLILACLLFLPGNVLARQSASIQMSAPDRVTIGDPFSLWVSTEQSLSAVEISWLGEEFRLPLQKSRESRNGEIILGTQVGEDEPGTYWIGVRALEGVSLVHKWKIRVESKEFPSQHLTLPEESITLSESQLERYKKDKRTIHAALNTRSAKRFWSPPLRWPALGDITSTYGLSRILNDKPRSPHTGIDLALPSGTPVRATETGRVILTGEFLFEGKSVFIDHGRGLISMYFHLASIGAKEEQIVERGEVIGRSGRSGRSTGSHLHFGLSALDRLVNPLPLLLEQEAARAD